jgi:putative flippase GtrA
MIRFNAFTGAILGAVRTPRAALELRRLGKFAVVGLSGFIIDFSVLNLLMFRFGLPAWAANTCSFTAAVSNTFIWNRLWTFPESRRRPLTTQFAQFFVVNLAGLAINMLTFLGSHVLIWSHFFAPGWSYNLAKATASGVALFWNFGANRAWTLRGL